MYLQDSSERGICQNPDLASSLVKYFDPVSCARSWSTEFSGCTSLFTALLSSVRSTQILTDPLGLGTTTIPAHHSVGSVISDMTPCESILSISFLTYGRSGWVILRGVKMCRETASSFNFMEQVSSSFPNPLNSSGNSVSKLGVGLAWTLSILATRPSLYSC